MNLYKVVYDTYIPARNAQEAYDKFLKYLRTTAGVSDFYANSEASLEVENYEGDNWDG